MTIPYAGHTLGYIQPLAVQLQQPTLRADTVKIRMLTDDAGGSGLKKLLAKNAKKLWEFTIERHMGIRFML